MLDGKWIGQLELLTHLPINQSASAHGSKSHGPTHIEARLLLSFKVTGEKPTSHGEWIC